MFLPKIVNTIQELISFIVAKLLANLICVAGGASTYNGIFSVGAMLPFGAPASMMNRCVLGAVPLCQDANAGRIYCSFPME